MEVGMEPTLEVGDYVSADRPELAMIASGAASEMANRRYNKLLRGGSALRRVLSVQQHAVAF